MHIFSLCIFLLTCYNTKMLNTLQKTTNIGTNATQRLGDEILKNTDNILIGGVVIFGAVLIQIFFPPGTRTISRRTWMENFGNLLKHGFWGILSTIPAKYLKEYRCPACNKLLAKGNLIHKDDVLEVKCRGCSGVYLFRGEDAEIIEKRSELLKKGLIPDPEPAK